MKKINKLFIGVAMILVVAILLKPNLSRFNQFASGLNVKPHKTLTRKISDYLVYAVYVKDTYLWNSDDDEYQLVTSEKYCGYLLNFHKMKN